jgi:hypothetical protein
MYIGSMLVDRELKEDVSLTIMQDILFILTEIGHIHNVPEEAIMFAVFDKLKLKVTEMLTAMKLSEHYHRSELFQMWTMLMEMYYNHNYFNLIVTKEIIDNYEKR